MTTKKQSLGQFYTTNYKYILNNMLIPSYVSTIIEPFCGNGDLLNFVDKSKYNFECYDIDPKKITIIQRDTIKDPPDYNSKFILTNPPYLARNKCNNKELFNKYDVNDLYKCFIKELLINKPLGGILIVPLNFWSSIRKNDIELRKDFLEIYNILLINIFEENVFDDTSYTVCCFQFELKKEENLDILIKIYPSKKEFKIKLNEDNNYIIGGEIYNLKSNINIYRLTKKNKNKKNTNILAKCIDDSNINKINLSLVDDDKIYIDNTPNLSSRTYATLIIEPEITIDKQKKLVDEFNKYINEHRDKYNSLFLANYRESKDIARKRISFDLIYNICGYILENII